MTKRPDFCTLPRLILGVIIVWEEGNAQNEFYSYGCVNNWEGLVIKENSINWIGSYSFFFFFSGGRGCRIGGNINWSFASGIECYETARIKVSKVIPV